MVLSTLYHRTISSMREFVEIPLWAATSTFSLCFPTAGFFALCAVLFPVFVSFPTDTFCGAAVRTNTNVQLFWEFPSEVYGHVFLAILLLMGILAASFHETDVIFFLNEEGGERARNVRGMILALFFISVKK